jgi:hypothetical protein
MSPRQVIASGIAILHFSAISAWPAYGQMATEAPISGKKFSLNAPNSTLRSAVEELARQTGLEVEIGGVDGTTPVKAMFAKVDFWTAVDALAAQSGSRVVIGQGKSVRLVKATNTIPPCTSVDGPFRIAARTVEARLDLQTGKTLYDLTLELAWEPRLPVYRVDAYPRIAKGADDAGRALAVKPFDARNPVDGVVTLIRVPLEGLNRSSKQISLLQGSLRVTAAEEMLRFAFDDLTKPMALMQNGVEVALQKFAKEGTFWIVDVELRYPKVSASFESFETYWVGRNRLTLVAPDGAAKFTTADEEINGNRVRYRFKEDKAMQYEAPGVLREVPVAFELKGIALP